MTRVPTIIAAVAATLIFGSGVAFGQFVPRPNEYTQEVVATQNALEEALMHLQRIKDPHFPELERAYAYIVLAHTELGAPYAGHPLPGSLQQD